MEEEQWKVIEGYENYEVSNYGQIRNNRRNGTILKPNLMKTGYYRVDLYKEGIATHKHIHCLVCKAFVERTNNSNNIVDHINRVKTDNRAENLRWCNFSINNSNKDFSKITNCRNTSGRKNICWYKNYNKWRVRIRVNNKDKSIGYFDDFDEAVRKLEEAEQFYLSK